MIFPKRNVLVISVCLLANGMSSYRDVKNIVKLTKEKWNSTNIILSDNTSFFKEAIEIKNNFLPTLENIVGKYSKTHDILFTISAHGYNMYNKNEIDNTDEYIIVRGNKIFDHHIRNSFYKKMHKDCLSLCLIDTCHSGTMLDLPWYSRDGKTIKRIDQKLIIRPQSYCISACSDNELAGEDISDFGGWGGKLICIFLDYLKDDFNILDFYQFVHKKFTSQRLQRSHPILSSTNKFL
jgi:hypothetical protein